MADADFLALTLAGHPSVKRRGETPWLTWEWLDEGVIALSPRRPAAASLVLSAGIHGNETAPVELINILLAELMAGRIPLAPRLLVILGNPGALRAGTRYLDYDLNRLFSGNAGREIPDGDDTSIHRENAGNVSERHRILPGEQINGQVAALVSNNRETVRSLRLKQVMGQFYQAAEDTRWHLDLHTAIRESHHVRFGLLPYQPAGYDPALLHWLNAAGLDAVVRHRAAGSTFTQYSSEQFSAASVTLELGKALPFGANDLTQFSGIRAALWAFVSGEPVAERCGPPIKHYRVSQQITRTQADFALSIPADTLNFSVFNQGELLARETGREYRVQEAREWVLFPNPNVAIGLRAGLMLVEDEDFDNIVNPTGR